MNAHWTQAHDDALKTHIAAQKDDTAIGALMGYPSTTIQYHRRKLGLPSGYTQKRPVPEDFIRLASGMTIKQAIQHWCTSSKMVMSWHEEAGTMPRKRKLTPRQEAKAKFRPQFVLYGLPRAAPTPPRENTLAGMAQLFLQRWCPVFRASVLDPKAPADLWVVAGHRLSEADMIARAERHGFQASLAA